MEIDSGRTAQRQQYGLHSQESLGSKLKDILYTIRSKGVYGADEDPTS